MLNYLFRHAIIYYGYSRPNLSDARPPTNKFHPAQECQTRGGKGEELRLQSQEDQELSAGAGASQLILEMISEQQTVDHTNKIMSSDHGAIFVRFRTAFSNVLDHILCELIAKWVSGETPGGIFT